MSTTPKLSINLPRPVTVGHRTYTGRTVTAELADRHARLVEHARTATDRTTRAFYLDRAHRLLSR